MDSKDFTITSAERPPAIEIVQHLAAAYQMDMLPICPATGDVCYDFMLIEWPKFLRCKQCLNYRYVYYFSWN